MDSLKIGLLIALFLLAAILSKLDDILELIKRVTKK